MIGHEDGADLLAEVRSEDKTQIRISTYDPGDDIGSFAIATRVAFFPLVTLLLAIVH